MPPSFDVLSYGYICIDHIIRVPHLPSPDHGAIAMSDIKVLGGNATNTAAYLCQWGLSVALAGYVIGDDFLGDLFMEEVAKVPRLSGQYLERATDMNSMYCIVMVTPDGERSMVGVNEDKAPLSRVTVQMIEDARIMSMDLYGETDTLVEAAQLASQAKVPVVIGDLQSIEHPILPFTSIAISSAAEVRRIYPNKSIEEFARNVMDNGAREVIVTDGAADVRLFSDDGNITHVVPTSVEVVDATGAGDTFRAGVVYGKLNGLNLIDSAALGVATGTLCVSREGGTSNPPHFAQVQELADSLKRVHKA